MASLRDCAILDRACNTGVDHQLAEIDRQLAVLGLVKLVSGLGDAGRSVSDNRAAAAYERRVERYYGGDGPQTLAEQQQTARGVR